jgi:hypothetical protein
VTGAPDDGAVDGPPEGGPTGPGNGTDPWIRRVGMVLAGSLVVAVLAAAVVAALGGGGAGAAVVLLLVLAVGVSIAAVLALATAAIGEFRGSDVSWRRPVLGVVLLLAAMALSAMTAAAM